MTYDEKQPYNTWNRFYLVHLPLINDLQMSCLVQILSLSGSSHLRPLTGQSRFCELKKHKKILTLTTLKYFCMNHGYQKDFFQFEIVIIVLVSSFGFILLPMLFVY